MSKKRKWILKGSAGYVGTNWEEEVDLIDDHGWSEEQLEEATDEEIQAELDEVAWEMAIEDVCGYATPVECEEE